MDCRRPAHRHVRRSCTGRAICGSHFVLRGTTPLEGSSVAGGGCHGGCPVSKPITNPGIETLVGAGDGPADFLAGWIALPRALMHEPVFGSAEMLHLFLFCLYEAAWKPRTVFVETGRGKTRVDLEPGQLVFGRLAWGERLKLAPETVRDRMKKLQQWGYIDIKPATHFSVVTICDWQSYRPRLDDNPPPNRQATATQPPHSNNSNKENNENKVESPEAVELRRRQFLRAIESSSKPRHKRTGIEAINFADIDFGTIEGMNAAIERLAEQGLLTNSYEEEKQVVFACMLTAKKKPKQPGAYFIRILKAGNKYTPTDPQEKRLKQIMEQLGWAAS
jgi:hypothetical protein